MVAKDETLKILNREKVYEDKLVTLLFNYYITAIDDINDIEEKDKKILKEKLSVIASDSERHSDMFNMLIQMVFENDKNNY